MVTRGTLQARQELNLLTEIYPLHTSKKWKKIA